MDARQYRQAILALLGYVTGAVSFTIITAFNGSLTMLALALSISAFSFAILAMTLHRVN